MKVTLLCMLIVVILATYVEAQGCRNQPRRPSCVGGMDIGRGGSRRCRPSLRWWWNGVRCLEMPYQGCGGNNNRHCTLEQCQRRCGRGRYN